MTGNSASSGLREARRPQHRRFSKGHLALIWAGFAIFVFLVFLLADGRPVNWIQGVVTALCGATALIAVLAWEMRERIEPRGPEDFL